MEGAVEVCSGEEILKGDVHSPATLLEQIIWGYHILETPWIFIVFQPECCDKGQHCWLSGFCLINERSLTLSKFGIIFLVNNEISWWIFALAKVDETVIPVYEQIHLRGGSNPRICLCVHPWDSQCGLYLSDVSKTNIFKRISSPRIHGRAILIMLPVTNIVRILTVAKIIVEKAEAVNQPISGFSWRFSKIPEFWDKVTFLKGA